MSTVLFGSDGVVKLADFGLGKLLDRNQIFTRSLVGVSLCVARKVHVACTLQMLTLVIFDGLGCLQTPGYLAPVCNVAPLLIR
jgi:hypothetical protein